MSTETSTRNSGGLNGEIILPPRSAPLGVWAILTTIAFLIAPPLLGRLPSGPKSLIANDDRRSLDGLRRCGFDLGLIAVAFLANDINAKTLAVMVFAFVMSLACASLIGRFIEPIVFPVIYLIAPTLFVGLTPRDGK